MDASAILPLVAVMAITGAIAGVVAGLLGVGGGIVVVPVLEFLLRFLGVDPQWSMHVAVATSLATIIPTSISSARAQHARGAIDGDLARSWIVPLLLGGLAGSLLASRAHNAVLSATFGAAALVVAIKMLSPLRHWVATTRPPPGILGGLLATAIGAVSSLMGIGGGTLAVPTLTIFGLPIHRAVGTSALLGLFISVPGTIGYLLADAPDGLPWGTVGLVSLIGVLLIAPASMYAAPIGVRLAHMLSPKTLSMCFGAFLGVVAGRMLFLTLTR